MWQSNELIDNEYFDLTPILNKEIDDIERENLIDFMLVVKCRGWHESYIKDLLNSFCNNPYVEFALVKKENMNEKRAKVVEKNNQAFLEVLNHGAI